MSWLGIKMQCDQVNEVIGEGGFARCFSAAWETGPPAERDSVLKVGVWKFYPMVWQIWIIIRSKCLPMIGSGTVWTKCTQGNVIKTNVLFYRCHVMIGPSLIVFDRFKSLSHPLKEEAVQWQTGFMATPRCFTYRLNLKKEIQLP